jgi:hypothetical protein
MDKYHSCSPTYDWKNISIARLVAIGQTSVATSLATGKISQLQLEKYQIFFIVRMYTLPLKKTYFEVLKTFNKKYTCTCS